MIHLRFILMGLGVAVVVATAQNNTPTAVFRSVNGDAAISLYGNSTSAILVGGGNLQQPASAQAVNGDTFVAVLDTWNGLWVNAFSAVTNQWVGWRFAGGILAGTPAIALAPNGIAYIACRDAWNAIWINSFTYSTGFSGWQNLNGVFHTNPSMTVTSDGLVHIVSRDTAGGTGQTWIGTYTPGTGFGGWRNTGGVGAGSPSVVGGANNAAYITLRDVNGYAWLARAGHGSVTWFYSGQQVNSDPQASQTNGVVTVAALVGTTVRAGTFFEGPDAWQAWEGVGGNLVNLALAAQGTTVTMAGRDSIGGLWWYQGGSSWIQYSGATFTGGPVAGAPAATRKANIVVMLERSPSGSSMNTYHFQADAASGTSWLTSWTEFLFPLGAQIPVAASFVSAWAGSAWTTKYELRTPTQIPFGNVYTTWDHVRNRFVAVAQDGNFGTGTSIWFAFSDGSGRNWQVQPVPVLSSSFPYQWDLPSVGINAQGHIAIGAASKQGNNPNGFWTVISLDGGVTFSPVPNRVSFAGSGVRSRIVGTDTKFHVFSPVLGGLNLPVNVARFESISYNSSGITWGLANNIFPTDFTAPIAYSALQICDGARGCGNIWYAPYLEAKGYTNGMWAVAFSMSVDSKNYIYIHTSSRGGGIAHRSGPDQFLPAVSVSGDGGYWLSYWTFQNESPVFPLVKRHVLYFPLGEVGIGAEPKLNVNPSKWVRVGTGLLGCLSPVGCFEAGDYHTMASNPFAGSLMPYVDNGLPGPTSLGQQFLQDPPAPLQPAHFKPVFFPIDSGTDLKALAGTPVRESQSGRPFSTWSAFVQASAAQAATLTSK